MIHVWTIRKHSSSCTFPAKPPGLGHVQNPRGWILRRTKVQLKFQPDTGLPRTNIPHLESSLDHVPQRTCTSKEGPVQQVHMPALQETLPYRLQTYGRKRVMNKHSLPGGRINEIRRLCSKELWARLPEES